MKASELKAGDFIEMSYGAMHATGLIIIHGIEITPECRTSSGVVVSEARPIVVGTRLNAEGGPIGWSMHCDRDSDEVGIGSWKLLDKADAAHWLAA